jgi:hypothetical protein
MDMYIVKTVDLNVMKFYVDQTGKNAGQNCELTLTFLILLQETWNKTTSLTPVK